MIPLPVLVITFVGIIPLIDICWMIFFLTCQSIPVYASSPSRHSARYSVHVSTPSSATNSLQAER